MDSSLSIEKNVKIVHISKLYFINKTKQNFQSYSKDKTSLEIIKNLVSFNQNPKIWNIWKKIKNIERDLLYKIIIIIIINLNLE